MPVVRLLLILRERELARPTLRGLRRRPRTAAPPTQACCMWLKQHEFALAALVRGRSRAEFTAAAVFFACLTFCVSARGFVWFACVWMRQVVLCTCVVCNAAGARGL